MTEYAAKTVETADGLSIFYRDYSGPPRAAEAPVLCLHGLTRNSADFEDLAPQLSRKRRVLAMDVRGRGRSDYDPNPRTYHLGSYVADVLSLLDAERLDRVVLIGTSMGGLIGMMLGAERPQALAGLVLNDIGPVIEPAGLARIAGYVGKTEPVESWEEARAEVKAINEDALPDLDDADWDRFARRLFREDEAGRPVPAYDPAIAEGFAGGGATPPDMWAQFEALAGVPVLVLRGAHSDILSAETAEAMAARHSLCETVTIPNRGHAPMLDEPAALKAIESFLERPAKELRTGSQSRL